MNYWSVILLVLLGVLGIQGDCKISRYMVENTNRIFTYRDASGAYQLLRTEQVASGLRLYMFCDAKDVLETECQDNGRFTVELPMRCGSPMQPTVQKSRDAACPETLFIVGYWIGGQQLELFRSCYDTKNGRVLYAQSDVYYKSYFAKRPNVEFLTDQIVTPAEAAAYMKHNMHDAFRYIYGNSQGYIRAGELVINSGHLVASADFLFCDQMSSTFRYINIVPQFKTINDGNWEKIERWLRSQVQVQTPFRIKTGGLEVLILQDEQQEYRCAFLSGAKLPVPLWIYKVVRDFDNGNGIYVFLSYNSVFEKQRPNVLADCQAVTCPLSLPDNPNDGFIYCCDPNNFPY